MNIKRSFDTCVGNLNPPKLDDFRGMQFIYFIWCVFFSRWPQCCVCVYIFQHDCNFVNLSLYSWYMVVEFIKETQIRKKRDALFTGCCVVFARGIPNRTLVRPFFNISHTQDRLAFNCYALLYLLNTFIF